jgi:MFS family permease
MTTTSSKNVTDISEKLGQADLGFDTDLSIGEVVAVPGYDADLSWTKSEERTALLKVDTLILPFIVLLFCFLQFDRTNISNALTDTLRKDINITNKEINLAQTLFILGFVITELPFNMISKVMGPERFLPITMFLWGTVTWCQVFIKSAKGLYAARFFLGALEGGYIPGMVVYISKFYTNQELGVRYAIFWASNSIAGALGGPLSIGLLSLRGKHDLAGWQWLYLIGEFSCLLLMLSELANLSHRGHLDCLPRRRCIPLPSPRPSCTKVLLRSLVERLHTPSRLHNHHALHPQ